MMTGFGFLKNLKNNQINLLLEDNPIRLNRIIVEI